NFTTGVQTGPGAETMKHLTKCVVMLAFLFGMAQLTSADVVVPKSKGSKSTKSPIRMSIIPDRSAGEARLEIPRSVLNQLRAELDGDRNEQIAETAGTNSQSANTQTAMAGIFLSLALAFGGIWLLRSRKEATRLSRAQLGIAVLALCATSASFAYANAGPPPVARSLTSKILIQEAKWYGAYGQVKVVTNDDDGDTIRLLLPIPKDDK
ncbi:MAG TPA: hypothetical protein VFV34_13265, partial [Blastocatellia bacterium]|nr:hypothetical protein [Blastocatellia bacterium]